MQPKRGAIYDCDLGFACFAKQAASRLLLPPCGARRTVRAYDYPPSGSSTAAEIAHCLFLPPAAAARNPPGSPFTPARFESTLETPLPTTRPILSDESCCWWGRVDSNHRRHCQQIYSLSPLATREHPHIYGRRFPQIEAQRSGFDLKRRSSGRSETIRSLRRRLELVDGFEPPTCLLQISCSTG